MPTIRVDAAPSRNESPRARMKGIYRARIVGVALELVRENGYGGLELDVLCARAKISRRTVYELTGGREGCFLAVLETAVARVSESMRTAYEEASSAGEREGVRAALGTLLAFVEGEPELARAMVVDAVNGGPVILRYRSKVLVRLAEALEGAWKDRGATTAPWPRRADWMVAALFGVLHARLVARWPMRDAQPVREVVNPLMATAVLVYAGRAAAEEELQRSVQEIDGSWGRPAGDPLEGLQMRITARTLRVLAAIAEVPGSNNREVALAAGVRDAGQASKLLRRLAGQGMIENTAAKKGRGAQKAWRLTGKGEEVLVACGVV
jgi:AcrR family transcriptional regulator